MMHRINNYFISRRQTAQEQGAAMVFALMTLMVLILAVVLVSTTAITQAQTSRALNTNSVYRDAADAALQNALYTANSHPDEDILEQHRGANRFVSGQYQGRTGIEWRWWTEQVVFSGQRVGYYVYASGYTASVGHDDPERFSQRASFVPTNVVAGGQTPLGNVAYTLPFDSVFQWGLTGTSRIEVTGNAAIYSSDSFYSRTPSGTTQTGTVISSNGIINLGSNAAARVNSISFSNQAVDQCQGTNCAAATIVYRNYDIGLSDLTERVTSTCPGTSYPIWVASANNGVLNIADNSCVGGLVFDVNTTVPANWSPNIPLTIYNTGDVTVAGGVSVNQTNSPQSLEIYSNTGSLTVGAANQTTRASFYYASAQGTCQTVSRTTFFGSIACANVVLGANSVTYIDLASYDRAVDATARNIWSVREVQETSSV